MGRPRKRESSSDREEREAMRRARQRRAARSNADVDMDEDGSPTGPPHRPTTVTRVAVATSKQVAHATQSERISKEAKTSVGGLAPETNLAF